MAFNLKHLKVWKFFKNLNRFVMISEDCKNIFSFRIKYFLAFNKRSELYVH